MFLLAENHLPQKIHRILLSFRPVSIGHFHIATFPSPGSLGRREGRNVGLAALAAFNLTAAVIRRDGSCRVSSAENYVERNVFPNLRQIWDTFRSNLTGEGPYVASVSGITLKTRRITRRGRTKDLILRF